MAIESESEAEASAPSEEMIEETTLEEEPPAEGGDAGEEPAEKELACQVPQTAQAVAQLSTQRNYEQALLEVSRLRPAIDNFFDKVMVMVEDQRVRANRLALLQTLLREFSTIADFSEIVTEGKESKESKE